MFFASQCGTRSLRWKKASAVCCHSFGQHMLNPRAFVGKTNTVGFAKSDNVREGSKDIH